jgi:AraC family transcriptional regulator
MKPKVLLIKNMVCNRCIMTVENILKNNSITFNKVLLGEAYLNDTPTSAQQQALQADLLKNGFELIDNHISGLIEKIKLLVIKKARNETDEKDKRLNLSQYLSEHLHYEYTHLSSIFSSVEGRTIENYFIEQRIEKAKELLVYGQMTLSEIAYELDYSSSAHLSSQFKKVSGLTPSYFKKVGSAKRQALDKI